LIKSAMVSYGSFLHVQKCWSLPQPAELAG
jgi:hypothetical protein